MAAVPNVDQAKAWNGLDGEHWAAHSDGYERSTNRHRRHLVAHVHLGDDVLDIGCGTGPVTRDAANAGARSVVGVDLSGPMLARAGELSRHFAGVRFVQADAQTHDFDAQSVDLVVSSFGVMFFDDPVAAFTNVRGALRTPGRLAMLVWQDLDRNAWLSAIRAALAVGRTLPTPPEGAPGPTSLGNPDRSRSILTEAGFGDIAVTEVREPVDFGDMAGDAFAYFRDQPMVRGLTADLAPEQRDQALDNLRTTFVAHQCAEGVLIDSASWLVTAHV